MTRMSPGRAQKSAGDAVLLDARWRVRQASALTVVIEAEAHPNTALVSVRLPHGTEHVLRATLESCAGEWTVRSEGEGQIPAFTLSCVLRDDAPALVVTDLPAQLGLMGGTYELEPQRS